MSNAYEQKGSPPNPDVPTLVFKARRTTSAIIGSSIVAGLGKCIFGDGVEVEVFSDVLTIEVIEFTGFNEGEIVANASVLSLGDDMQDATTNPISKNIKRHTILNLVFLTIMI
jgi:hypothetical protein